MKDLDELEQTILAAARAAYTPGTSEAARVRSASLAAIVGGATVPLDPQGVLESWSDALHDSVDALTAATTVPRVLGVALVLSGVGAGGYGLGLRAGRAEAPRSPSPLTAAPIPTAGSLPPPVPERTTAAVPVEPAPRVPARVAVKNDEKPPPSTSELPAPADALEVELQTLRRVERAQRAQNPRLALALLGELDRSVPGGKLDEERSAARTVASCTLEPAASVAAASAAEFSARFPGSVYLPRVRSACGISIEADERKAGPPETAPSKGRSP